MTVLELLNGVETIARSSDSSRFSVQVEGIQYDSRRIQRGDLFVAMKGESSNGNRHIPEAIARGAVAVVSDAAPPGLPAGLAWAQVAHGRRALAAISANFYEHPAARLKITGVTGTNGKTTTTFLLTQLLHALGYGEVTLIGTIEYQVGGQVMPAPHTTPEALELNSLFAQTLRAKSSEVVMEVSSHALAQERVYGVPYEVAIFTNLTRDHLDYHQTMENYFDAKRKLFAGLGARPPRFAVINADDEHGRRLLQEKSSASQLSYGLRSGEYRAESLKFSSHGAEFDFQTPHGKVSVQSPLLGTVNVYNLLAAAAAALARGSALDALPAAIAACHSAPGRFERVECGQPFAVVVDYAHTDDALRNLTALARDFNSVQRNKGRIITVFGCGGDRDRTKRPLMGAAAGDGSDFVVLTSDNPRSEDPQAIIDEVVPGLRKSNVRFTVEADRRKAIQIALTEAKPADIVLIAGKGHEKVQVTRAGSAHFDDVEVARELLQSLGYGLEPAANQVASNKS